ncbi:MAG: 2-hydroxyacid dehydrogenase [Pseudomonadota bacterium]
MPYYDKLAKIKGHQITYFDALLKIENAFISKDFDAICCFVTDNLQAEVLEILAGNQIKYIVLRSSGYDHIDMLKANDLGIKVSRVPAYSPYAIAEFSLGLLLMLTRKLHHAYAKVKQNNFSLKQQIGINLSGRTVGIIGTGQIGSAFAHLIKAFNCNILAHDPKINPQCEAIGVKYTSLDELLFSSEVISLHCTLNDKTRQIINQGSLAKMKRNVIIINTGRGALLDTNACLKALKGGRIGAMGLDVYEHEKSLFYVDRSDEIIMDDTFVRLNSFPNVIITGHQAFLTKEALANMAEVTIENLTSFENGDVINQV